MRNQHNLFRSTIVSLTKFRKGPLQGARGAARAPPLSMFLPARAHFRVGGGVEEKKRPTNLVDDRLLADALIRQWEINNTNNKKKREKEIVRKPLNNSPR